MFLFNTRYTAFDYFPNMVSYHVLQFSYFYKPKMVVHKSTLLIKHLLSNRCFKLRCNIFSKLRDDNDL